jgi:hypothetical protein
MSDINDRRLTNQLSYLKGATLMRTRYTEYREGWEHDHCVFCWVKFKLNGGASELAEGFATPDRYFWVCPTCFEDFRALFDWKLGTA